jgi:hypothetical protein
VQPVESTTLPWPVFAAAPHCAALVSTGITTGPAACGNPAVSFMLVRYPRPRGVWCVFLCASHHRDVPLAEPLDQVAAAELADRRAQHALALAGQPYRRAVPLQLR